VVLHKALCEEEQARQLIREAQVHQAEALRLLRELGVPYSIVAVRVARLRGSTLHLDKRLRLDAVLRQRLSRVTKRHGILRAASGADQAPQLGSLWAITPDHGESNMARLVKRVVTEEYIEKREDEDDGEELELGEHEEEDEVDEDEPRPSRRRK